MTIFAIVDGKVLPYILDPNFERYLPTIPSEVKYRIVHCFHWFCEGLSDFLDEANIKQDLSDGVKFLSLKKR